jgi:hypothetical protein
MPAQSKAQQKFMGMVHSYKQGDMKDAPSSVKKAASSMTDKDAKDFASTKHTGKPEKVEEHFYDAIKKMYESMMQEAENNKFRVTFEVQFNEDPIPFSTIIPALDKDDAIRQVNSMYPDKKTTVLNVFSHNPNRKDLMGVKESTASWESSLRKMAKDRTLKMLSKKDKATLTKIADMMAKANESLDEASITFRDKLDAHGDAMQGIDHYLGMLKKIPAPKKAKYVEKIAKQLQRLFTKKDESVNEAQNKIADIRKILKTKKGKRIDSIFMDVETAEKVIKHYKSLRGSAKEKFVKQKIQNIVKSVDESVDEAFKIDVDKMLQNPAIRKLLKVLGVVKLQHQQGALKIIDYFANHPSALGAFKKLSFEWVNEARTINVEPNWEGLYRFMMHLKKGDNMAFTRVTRKMGSDWKKLAAMADKNKWKTESINERKFHHKKRGDNYIGGYNDNKGNSTEMFQDKKGRFYIWIKKKGAEAYMDLPRNITDRTKADKIHNKLTRKFRYESLKEAKPLSKMNTVELIKYWEKYAQDVERMKQKKQINNTTYKVEAGKAARSLNFLYGYKKLVDKSKKMLAVGKKEHVKEVAMPFSQHLRDAQEEIEYMISEHPGAAEEGVYKSPGAAIKFLNVAQKALRKIK